MNALIVQPYTQILEQTSAELVSQMLSSEDLQKASRFYHKQDADRFIAARILLWH